MIRLDAKYLYAGDVLHGVGNCPEERTLTSVMVRDDGFVDLTFADGSKTMTQCNSYFRLETYEVPIEARSELRDDFRQTLRDSQRQFRASKGEA